MIIQRNNSDGSIQFFKAVTKSRKNAKIIHFEQVRELTYLEQIVVVGHSASSFHDTDQILAELRVVRTFSDFEETNHGLIAFNGKEFTELNISKSSREFVILDDVDSVTVNDNIPICLVSSASDSDVASEVYCHFKGFVSYDYKMLRGAVRCKVTNM